MRSTKEQFAELFKQLDREISCINQRRQREGTRPVPKAEVTLLGQTSLMVDENVSAVLSLAQTGDLDALLVMEQVVKDAMKELLKKQGLIYDEDSYLIWIPKDKTFIKLFDYKNIVVNRIDPESALVSKAVKAPEKNKQLIREAIASGRFPNLMDRIESFGGNLEIFAKD